MSRAYDNENDPAVIAFRAELGSRLVDARRRSKMSQLDASRLAGLLTQASLSNYENGKRDIPVRTLVALAGVYGVPVQMFVRGATTKAVAS